MSLPIQHTDDQDLMLLQTKWSSAINPVINQPWNSGVILKSVVLATGSNTINHKLGRALQGWVVIRMRSSATVYDTQDSNTMPALTLKLTASANVTVDLLVF